MLYEVLNITIMYFDFNYLSRIIHFNFKVKPNNNFAHLRESA